MKVSGDTVLHAPVEEVWKALNDPAVLVRTIPGCGRLEEVGPDRYQMTVTAGVAAIKGTYQGEVALTDQEHPRRFVLRCSGAGAPGTINADVVVTLDRRELGEADGEGTALTYEADAVVGGPVGGVGQRVLSGVAKKNADEFFRAVDDVLTGAAQPPTPDDAVPASAPEATAVPSVFTRPEAASGGGDEAAAFLKGGLLGAAIALLGVLVGARIARGRR